MAKYLICSTYTEEGLKGLLKEGGTKRVEASRKAIESLGGTLEAFYFAESYHKDYYKKHPKQAYCQAVITPKLVKLQQRYLNKLKMA